MAKHGKKQSERTLTLIAANWNSASLARLTLKNSPVIQIIFGLYPSGGAEAEATTFPLDGGDAEPCLDPSAAGVPPPFGDPPGVGFAVVVPGACVAPGDDELVGARRGRGGK